MDGPQVAFFWERAKDPIQYVKTYRNVVLTSEALTAEHARTYKKHGQFHMINEHSLLHALEK